MASGYATLGAAKRSMVRRQKKTNVVSGLLDTASSALAFAGTQAKKADTAWGEYEKGYEALGGTDPIKKPKLWEKGGFKSMFKGPEGEVRIGGSIYDRGQVQKAGGVLGSDIGAALSDDARESFLGRTAPGRKAPGSIEGFDYSSLIDPKTGKMVMSPEQYDIQVAGAQSRETARNLPLMKDPTIADFRSPPTSLQQWSVGGIESQSYLQPESVTPGPQIPESQLSENLPTYGMSAEQRSGRKAQEQQWDLQKRQQHQQARSWQSGSSWNPIKSYAKGGNFVTNGPEMIMVGDNPGGREAVNVVPLSSGDRSSNEKRSLLESLYANNSRRKKY